MVQIQSDINVNADTLCSVACPIDSCSDMTGFSNSVSRKLFAVIGFSDKKIRPLMQKHYRRRTWSSNQPTVVVQNVYSCNSEYTVYSNVIIVLAQADKLRIVHTTCIYTAVDTLQEDTACFQDILVKYSG